MAVPSSKGLVVVPSADATPARGLAPGLWEIANRPIVCHAVRAILDAGIDTLAIVAGSDELEAVRDAVDSHLDPQAELTYIAWDGPTDLLGVLQCAADFVGDDAVVAHVGDGLLGQRLDLSSDGFGGETPDLLLLLHRTGDQRERLGPSAQKLLGLSELNGTRGGLALAGICRFAPGALRRAVECGRSNGAPVDLVGVAEAMSGEGLDVEARLVRAWRRFRGDPLDLLELNRLVLDQQSHQSDVLDRGDNKIEGRVIIHPTAEIASSIILGPCIIGENARVSNSYIGPYTSVGAGAEIEGAEVERSIIYQGARIMHISERIEGSTIGRRATIFRDFGLPRALRFHVGEGVEVALD